MRDLKTGKPMNMNFIVGSMTTYEGKPPSFDVLYVEPSTMLPIELETYAFDLNSANLNDTPAWNVHIDYRRDYDLADLSPASFYNLSERIHINNQTCQIYNTNSAVGGPGVPWDDG